MKINFDFSRLSDRLLGCLINDSLERSQVSEIGRTLHDALVSEQERRKFGREIPVVAELPPMNFEEMLATLKEVSGWMDCLESAAHFSDKRGAIEIAVALTMLHEAELAVARERDSLLAASSQPLN